MPPSSEPRLSVFRLLRFPAVFGLGVLAGFILRGERIHEPVSALPEKGSAVVPPPPQPIPSAGDQKRQTADVRIAPNQKENTSVSTVRENSPDEDELTAIVASLRACTDFEMRKPHMERLFRYAKTDFNHTLAVLGLFRQVDDEIALRALAETLQGQEMSHHPEVMLSLREIVRTDPIQQRRLLALELMQYSSEMTGETVLLASADADPAVRRQSCNNLANYRRSQPGEATEIEKALQALARTDPEDEVRQAAINGLDLEESVAGLDELVVFLKADPSPNVRLKIVAMMTWVEPPLRKESLARLESVYPGEGDVDVRRSLLEGVVLTGRHEAPQILKRIQDNESDSGLRQDIADYLDILATGYVEESEIYDQKREKERARKEAER